MKTYYENWKSSNLNVYGWNPVYKVWVLCWPNCVHVDVFACKRLLLRRGLTSIAVEKM